MRAIKISIAVLVVCFCLAHQTEARRRGPSKKKLEKIQQETLNCDYNQASYGVAEPKPQAAQCSATLRGEDQATCEANSIGIRFTFVDGKCKAFCGCQPTTVGNNFSTLKSCNRTCGAHKKRRGFKKTRKAQRKQRKVANKQERRQRKQQQRRRRQPNRKNNNNNSINNQINMESV